MSFKITDHIDFDARGRAQCPVCLSDGKTGKNLALVPNTDGAYKCHRGCTPQQIREAIGAPKSQDRIIPTALAKPAPAPKYHKAEVIKANTERLINESTHAKQWLHDRGIDDEAIARHQIGIARKEIRKYEGSKLIDKKVLPCITVPYQYEKGYLQKYFVAPWLPSEKRLDTRMTQDYGLSARWWFTKREGNNSLIVCEGEWDAILLASQNPSFDIATSTTGCGNVPADLSELEGYERIFIFYDLDDAGEKGAQKLQAKLGDRSKICTVPHEGEPNKGYDVSDALLAGFTIDHFVEATQKANHSEKPNTSQKNTLKSRLTTTAELMARAKDYTDWLIDEILPINELILLAASPRAGKSLMAMNIAQCVASGCNFLDRPVTQGTVIYVQCEDSETKTKQRAIAQGWAENLPVYWLDRFKLSELPELIELAKELEPRLIVLDTLSRIRDDAHSESSAEMGRILEPLQEFARDYNCCVLPIHHTGKIKAENADTLDVFETIRGSSAIRATCRGSLVIAANETGYRLCVENGYNKQDLKVSLNLADLTWKLLGKWGVQVDQSQNDQVLDYLTKHEYATLEQIYEYTNINKASLYKVLARLVHDNKVTKNGSRRAVVYSRMVLNTPKILSDISDMSDSLSDSQIKTQTGIEVLSDKNQFFSDTATTQQQISDGQLSAVGHKLSDCQISNSNQDTVSVSESDKQSDKARFVRYKVGDLAEVRSGFFSGKVIEVTNVQGDQVWGIAKGWIGANQFSVAELTKLKKSKPKPTTEGDEF